MVYREQWHEKNNLVVVGALIVISRVGENRGREAACVHGNNGGEKTNEDRDDFDARGA